MKRTADIGVAVAAFYPTVTLNGTVGFQALDLKSLWKGASLEYNLGPSVTMPLFEGGKLTSTVNLRTAQQQEAWINYHETVLKAWHDVVNALVAYRTETSRHRILLEQVDHAGKALDLARSRYRDGVEQFVTVLDAERTLLAAQQQAAQSATNIAVDIVALYKALGGGWEYDFRRSRAYHSRMHYRGFEHLRHRDPTVRPLVGLRTRSGAAIYESPSCADFIRASKRSPDKPGVWMARVKPGHDGRKICG